MKTFFNKSSVTNLISVVIILIGYIFQQELIKSIGFFALSGAVTNWLAIYMLFEEIPFLYGSGVIPNRFEEFKFSIKQLMMQQFFTVNHIEQFIETEEQQGSKVLNLTLLLKAIDYDKIYESLVSSIMGSSLGGMLMMMGGEEVLGPLKTPVIEKIKITLTEMVESDRFKSALQHSLNAHKISEDIIGKIET
ncbi:MAG: DUF445 domain-containing protein, partial [Methylobacter sp.]